MSRYALNKQNKSLNMDFCN